MNIITLLNLIHFVYNTRGIIILNIYTQYKHIYKASVVKLEYYMQELRPKETMKLLHVKATVV